MTSSDIYYKPNPNINIDNYIWEEPTQKTLGYIYNNTERFRDGIVYCISCESWKKQGKYKIGMTMNFNLSKLKLRYKTYFGGEDAEIIKITYVGDTKNAEKLAHFLFKNYRVNTTEWICLGYNYNNTLELINYQFSYISYYYPTTKTYLEYMNNILDQKEYINLISNIHNTREKHKEIHNLFKNKK